MFLNNKEDHMSSFHSNTIMEVNHEGHIQVSDESEDSEPDFSFETAYQNITSKNKLIKNISKNASNSRDYEGRISYDFSSNKKYKISVTINHADQNSEDAIQFADVVHIAINIGNLVF